MSSPRSTPARRSARCCAEHLLRVAYTAEHVLHIRSGGNKSRIQISTAPSAAGSSVELAAKLVLGNARNAVNAAYTYAIPAPTELGDDSTRSNTVTLVPSNASGDQWREVTCGLSVLAVTTVVAGRGCCLCFSHVRHPLSALPSSQPLADRNAGPAGSNNQGPTQTSASLQQLTRGTRRTN